MTKEQIREQFISLAYSRRYDIQKALEEQLWLFWTYEQLKVCKATTIKGIRNHLSSKAVQHFRQDGWEFILKYYDAMTKENPK